ncbi:hypothetical protein, partial [Shewanella algae]|uniref:hypothetical protein n=1 Tax=Shewanella algae TaxID=38313 RepID=UPI00399A1BB4
CDITHKLLALLTVHLGWSVLLFIAPPGVWRTLVRQTHRQFVIFCFTRFYSLATHGLVTFNQPLFSYCSFSGSTCILKFIARSQHIRRN